MISEALKKKVGQMMMVGFPSPFVDDQARALLNDFYVGNYIYFGRNCNTGKQVAELSRDLSNMVYDKLGVAPFITIDQEGGTVSRLTEGAALMPGAACVSAATLELTDEYLKDVYQLGYNDGKILRACGITIANAPDLDVNIEPKNPIIGCRSYGDDPVRVAKVGTAMMLGMKAAGEGAAIKHFPGHGNVSSDSHLGIPVNDTPYETLLETEFKPFEIGFKNGAVAIMSAHVRYTDVDPEVPATLSHKIHTELLRERYGFEGVDMTDCLEMDAMRKFYPHGECAVRAIEAGVDILTISHTYEAASDAVNAIYAALESGRLTEERIDISYRRIMKLKKEIGLMEKQNIDPEEAMKEALDPEKIAHCQKLARRAITVIKGDIDVELNDQLLVIAPPQIASTGAEDLKRLSLVDAIVKECGAAGVEFPLNCKDESEMDPYVKKAEELIDQGYKKVLLGLFNARFRTAALKMLKMLEERSDIDLTVVLLGAPYDAEKLEGDEKVLTTYDYTDLGVSQLIKALKEKTFTGKLPYSKL